MGRRVVVWAVSGPSEAARQWPMTTNDDHQAYGPTASEQGERWSSRSPARPRARSHLGLLNLSDPAGEPRKNTSPGTERLPPAGLGNIEEGDEQPAGLEGP